MSSILDGRQIAEGIKQQLLNEISHLPQRPTLAILSFNSPASSVYCKAQCAQAKALGIQTVVEQAPMDVTPERIEAIIQSWNAEAKIDGIFVHQPMPEQINAQRVSSLILPAKDIEGIHPQNSARRFFAKARIGSCTALAVMALIESTHEAIAGKEAVVVGHSEIVGRPVGMLLLDALATTTICHVGTHQAQKLEEHVRRADILVVAVGKPHFVKGEWIKKGATVIDVGINVVGGHVVGDVEFETAKERARYITPVPGGVGPVTVMMVMKNTIEAWKLGHAKAGQ